jgi:glycosyltransferase involved in cell wall biosynthesis
MRIAQVAPLWERVPPPAYGGTELVVAHLANGLVERGHQVTLFATADSHTLADLQPGAPQAMRLAGVTPNEYQIYDLMQLTRVVQQANDFDVIHFHVDASALPYGNLLKTPVVHTVHGIIAPLTENLFIQNRHQNFVSISESQRRTDLELNYIATVYNGIDPDTYEFHPEPEQPPYLAFFGRISPEKGPHLAIELAKRTGWRLVIAGKVDPADQAFYEREIKHLIDGQQIVYVGEANHIQKSEIMGGAVATLCLLTWEEPFGLVMPESMVCGTPVIAMARGSAPELIVHGKTGFLCQTMEDCITALDQIETIDRKTCREHVAQNFSHSRMVEGYEAVYRQLIDQRIAQNGYLQRSGLRVGPRG